MKMFGTFDTSTSVGDIHTPSIWISVECLDDRGVLI